MTDTAGRVRKVGRAAFVCSIHHPDPKALFHPSTKRDRALATPRRRWRPVFDTIEPAGTADTQCVAVTHPSRLYITDDYVVTHNTAFALNIAQHVGQRAPTASRDVIGRDDGEIGRGRCTVLPDAATRRDHLAVNVENGALSVEDGEYAVVGWRRRHSTATDGVCKAKKRNERCPVNDFFYM